MTRASSADCHPGNTPASAMPASFGSTCEHATADSASSSCCAPLLATTAESWRSESATKRNCSSSLQFLVPGTPIAKGRPRFARRGNFVTAFAPERTVKFENLVKLVAAETMDESDREKFDGALRVEIEARFPIAKSWPRVKREKAACGLLPHTSKPDAENIAKAVLDACNEVVWHDDAQVARLTITKVYATEPGTRVWVHPL